MIGHFTTGRHEDINSAVNKQGFDFSIIVPMFYMFLAKLLLQTNNFSWQQNFMLWHQNVTFYYSSIFNINLL